MAPLTVTMVRDPSIEKSVSFLVILAISCLGTMRTVPPNNKFLELKGDRNMTLLVLTWSLPIRLIPPLSAHL
jgi:hypothetical protein